MDEYRYRAILTKGDIKIGTLDISMLIWNCGETRQRYSVLFESWKPERLSSSGRHMKVNRGGI